MKFLEVKSYAPLHVIVRLAPGREPIMVIYVRTHTMKYRVKHNLRTLAEFELGMQAIRIFQISSIDNIYDLHLAILKQD